MNNVSSNKEMDIKYQVYRANEISEIQTTTDGRDEEYIIASFEVESDIITQTNDYNKTFFASTHGVAFKRGNKAREDGTPEALRIEAAKINVPTAPYNFVAKDGNTRQASRVGIFVLRDEDPMGTYRRAIRDLDFIKFVEPTDTVTEKTGEVLTEKK